MMCEAAPPSSSPIATNGQPSGFCRQVVDQMVVYRAPDGSTLESLAQIVKYLTTKGTCKCGIATTVSLDDFNFHHNPAAKIKLVFHKSKTTGSWTSTVFSPHLKRKREYEKNDEHRKHPRVAAECHQVPPRSDPSESVNPHAPQEDKTSQKTPKCLTNPPTPCANAKTHNSAVPKNAKSENAMMQSEDRIKLDDLENSEIIILDSFDSRESDSDTKSETRVSTPDSICNERSAIFDQFRERYHQFHFKNFLDSESPAENVPSESSASPPAEPPPAPSEKSKIDTNDHEQFSIPSVFPENGPSQQIVSKDEDNNDIISSKQLRAKPESKLKTGRKRPAERLKSPDFNIGDLVWGRLSGSPAWPGIIVDPACIDNKELVKNAAKKTTQGKLWIMWYGEKNFTQMHPSALKSMEEGLTSPVGPAPRKTSKRLSDRLDKAIEEALLEYSRKENRLKLRKRTK